MTSRILLSWLRRTRVPCATAAFFVCIALALSCDGNPQSQGERDSLGLPSCLRDLFAACGTTGQCLTPAEGGGQRYCYASGARVESPANGIQLAACAESGVGQMSAFRQDGTLCFTVEAFNVMPGHACEGGDYAWRTADGALVAMGHSFGLDPISISCAGGEASTLSPFYGLISPAGCQSGACP